MAPTSSSPSTSSTGCSPRFLNSSSGTLPPSATSLTCAVCQKLSLQTAGSPERGRDGAAPPSSCTCGALRLSLQRGHDPVLRQQAHRKHLQRHERGIFPAELVKRAAIQLDRITMRPASMTSGCPQVTGLSSSVASALDSTAFVFRAAGGSASSGKMEMRSRWS